MSPKLAGIFRVRAEWLMTLIMDEAIVTQFKQILLPQDVEAKHNFSGSRLRLLEHAEYEGCRHVGHLWL